MSDCTKGEMRDLLPELMHGTLDASAQRAVAAHVASCAECAEELALLRALRPALSRGPVVNVERIAAAVQARVPAGRVPAPARGWRAAPWRIAIAAAAILAVGGLGYALALRGPGAATEVAQGPNSSAVVHSAPPAPVVAPSVVPAPSTPQQVAIAPAHTPSPGTAVATVESDGVIGNLSDLSDDDVRALTASIDAMSPVPDANPAPLIDPLGASLDELPAGGR